MITVPDIKETLQQLVPDDFASLVDGLELPAAFDAVENHIRHRTKRTRNTTSMLARFSQIKRRWKSHIHQLPPEILTMILLDVDGSGNRGTLELNHTLAKVCRRWRDLILDSPLFWRRVRYAASDSVEVVIRKSGTAKLDIVCDFTVSWTNPIDEAHFLERTTTLASRIKSLNIYYLNPLQQTYIKAVARYATTIILAAPPYFNPIADVVLLDPAAPTEVLIVFCVPIQWRHTDFQHLNSIVLYHLSLLPSTSQLQAIVAGCQNLELVAFMSCSGLETSESSDHTSTSGNNDAMGALVKIDSPRLKWLILRHVPQPIISFFSQNVAATACLHVHITGDYERDPIFDWSSQSFKRLAGGPLTNGALSDLKVTFDEKKKGVIVGDILYSPQMVQRHFNMQELQKLHQYSGLYLKANLRPEVPNPVAKVVEFLSDIPGEVTNLSIKHHEHFDRSDGLPAEVEALSQLTSVTHLTIDSSFAYLSLLEYVSTAQKDKGVPFPRLATLIFDFSLSTANFVKSILQMIRKRNRLAERQKSRISPITEIHTHGQIIELLEANKGFKKEGIRLVSLE